MKEIYEIAKEIQFNAKAEAQAIYDYTELLKRINEVEIKEKNEIISSIEELIADELNHETKLHQIYSFLTGIEQKND